MAGVTFPAGISNDVKTASGFVSGCDYATGIGDDGQGGVQFLGNVLGAAGAAAAAASACGPAWTNDTTGPSSATDVAATAVSGGFDETGYLATYLGWRHRGQAESVVLTAVYGVVLLTGVVGNVATCAVIVKNSCMHTATNYYLFSLAISDTLTLLLGR